MLVLAPLGLVTLVRKNTHLPKCPIKESAHNAVELWLIALISSDLILVEIYFITTRVTSPKGAKTRIFFIFFDVSGPRDWFQGLLQAFKFNFPSKMCDLDVYVSSYVTFRRF